MKMEAGRTHLEKVEDCLALTSSDFLLVPFPLPIFSEAFCSFLAEYVADKVNNAKLSGLA